MKYIQNKDVKYKHPVEKRREISQDERNELGTVFMTANRRYHGEC